MANEEMSPEEKEEYDVIVGLLKLIDIEGRDAALKRIEVSMNEIIEGLTEVHSVYSQIIKEAAEKKEPTK